MAHTYNNIKLVTSKGILIVSDQVKCFCITKSSFGEDVPISLKWTLCYAAIMNVFQYFEL